MRSNPSLSWQKLLDVYYSIRPCYENVKWPIDNLYSNFLVALSSPFTLMATASKFVPYPNVIDVFSVNGTKLWSLVYNSSLHDHIVGFCFHNEDLCVVLSNHKFRHYTDFDGTFNEYSYTDGIIKLINTTLGPDIDPGVLSVVITDLENNEQEIPYHVLASYVWGDYLVLRNKDKFTFTHIIDRTNFEVKLDGLEYSLQNEICYVSSTETSLVVLLSYGVTIYKLHVNFADRCYELIDEKLTDGPFSIMSASPNGSLIALLNSDLAKIFVITETFDRILLEYDTSNESSLPYMIEWAGNDAIVLSLRDEIKLVGPSQKSISFFYDIIENEEFNFDSSLVHDDENDLSFVIPLIKSEKDGLKILSKNKVEFLSRVPNCSVNLHLMGSSHPSLILLDCVDKLLTQASKADSNISLLKSEGLLRVAIEACLEASLEEFQPIWQQKILKAVSFGKIYADGEFNAEDYLRVLNICKVLNQLRVPELGLFLTYSEIIDSGWPAVIKMLLMRSQHLLALKIVDLLHLDDCRGAIYINWCQRKIRKELNMSDYDLFALVGKKLLNPSNGGTTASVLFSLSEIFDISLQEGRLDLFKLLVYLEPSGSSQIKQLLRINENELALIRTFQSCSYDLCKLLFLHFKNTLPPLELFQIVNQNEIKAAREANNVNNSIDLHFLAPYLRENVFVSGDLVGNFFQHVVVASDPKMLQLYLKLEGKTVETDTKLLNSLRDDQPDFEEGEDKYDNISLWFKNKLRPLKSNKFLKKAVDVESSLLVLQHRLSTMFQRSFFEETSVVNVIKKLINMNQLKQAAKVAKEFGLSQEKLWYLVLDIYSKLREFDRLHKFVISSNPSNTAVWKSPIGLKPIVESFLSYDAPKDLTSMYIGFCSELSYSQRVSLYNRNKDYKASALEAFSNKDINLLRQVLQLTDDGDESVRTEIKKYIQELGY